jgi:amino acid transporter
MAVVVIGGIGCLNLIGLRFGARFEVVLVTLKMLLLAGVCVAAAVVAPVSETAVAAATMPATRGAMLTALGGAMAAVVWSYDGYADAVYMAGETRDPGRALPRALFTALVAITGLYLLANVTFVKVLGVGRLAQTVFPALDVAQLAFGDSGSRMLTVIAVIVLLATVNGYFLTGPRIARLLAEEGLAPQAFGRMSESGAPLLGAAWMIVVSSAFALTNNFNQLLEITVPFMSATTALVAIGLLVQRARAPERPRPFRVRAAGLVVGLQVLLGLALLAGFIAVSPWTLAIDAGALVVGLIVYRFVRRRSSGRIA